MRHRQHGFTLLEVVVAFAIFALSIGALYELFSAAGKRSTQAYEREVAMLTAQSLLSQLRTQPMPWPADQTGKTEDGMAWQLSVAPYDTKIPDVGAWSTVEVTVRVHPELYPAREIVIRSIQWGRWSDSARASSS